MGKSRTAYYNPQREIRNHAERSKRISRCRDPAYLEFCALPSHECTYNAGSINARKRILAFLYSARVFAKQPAAMRVSRPSSSLLKRRAARTARRGLRETVRYVLAESAEPPYVQFPPIIEVLA